MAEAPLTLHDSGALTAVPVAALRGEARVPGDKSLSHRALILPALADGTTRVTGLNGGEDVAATRRALTDFGAQFADDSEAVLVTGTAGRIAEPDDVIDAGNSGTSLRLLAAVAAMGEGMTVFTGDASLRRRPVARVTEPLQRFGARCDARDGGRRAPLVVRGAGHARYGGTLRGQREDLPVASAQLKSALLLAGTGAHGRTSLREPHLSRDHTERLLAACGVPLATRDGRLELDGPALLHPPHDGRLAVARDPSAAAFLVVAALLCPDADVRIPGVCVNPTRTGWIDVLRAMGGDVRVEPAPAAAHSGGEPVGDLVARSSTLRATAIDGAMIPALVDEVPILAIAAACAAGTTTLRGAEDLRVKESDRLAVMAANLAACGVAVREYPDGLDITGRAPSAIRAAHIASHHDHRIAMSFAVLGLVAQARVSGGPAAMTIDDALPIATSFPGFVDALAALAR